MFELDDEWKIVNIFQWLKKRSWLPLYNFNNFNCLYETDGLLEVTGIDVSSYEALGHVPASTYNNLIFQCTLTYIQSLTAKCTLTVAWCKHLVTFVPLLTPNPDDATGRMQSCTLQIW